ncbi:MAG TPA: hypothetical protein VNI02_12825 [Blastocatellia bacterium]|jgi:hypothetical protein|nr:hypothetical protein [Blastocatellia bacterium]
MNKPLSVLAFLFAIVAVTRGAALPQDGDRPYANGVKPEAVDSKAPADKSIASDVEMLKRRIEELESQNRAMIQMLGELKARLDAPARLASAGDPRHDADDRKAADLNDRSAISPKPQVAAAQKPAAAVSSPGLSPGQAQPSAQSKPASTGEPPRWPDLISEGNRFKLYGFLRLDLDMDSQRPNNGQLPLFITSEDPRVGKPDAGSYSMHPRLTRFGVDYSGARIGGLGDGKLSGKLELDFENGGSESRQIIRIRHAYLRMNWSRFSILAGQTWDIVSPLFPTVNNDTLMWNAGNVGDRRPQFRFAYDPKVGRGQWSFIAGAGLTGAIDSQDLDANGFRDGEESGRPDLQARVGYSHPLWVKDQSASLGASVFYGWLNTARPVTNAARTSFRTQLVNIDYTLPLASRLGLRGEGWWGRNMSDTRGGAGQGINLVTGREIRGRGGWSELSVKLSRYYSFHPGFTSDDPVDEDIPTGGRTRNQAFYIGNRVTPGGNFLIGLDYLRWRTGFKGFLRGVDNRVNVFFQYSY